MRIIFFFPGGTGSALCMLSICHKAPSRIYKLRWSNMLLWCLSQQMFRRSLALFCWSYRKKIREELICRFFKGPKERPCPGKWQICLNFTSRSEKRKVGERRLNQHLASLSDPSLFYPLSSTSWKTVYLWIIYLFLKILNLWCPCPVSNLQGHQKRL